MAPAERIATFDNDGTLWTEQPAYFQFAFAVDRIKAKAPQHPEWRNKQPFKAVLANDTKAVAAAGEKGLLQIMAASHAGMTTAEFVKTVLDWTASARHPKFNRPYNSKCWNGPPPAAARDSWASSIIAMPSAAEAVRW